jgi:hypothetical protein
MQTDERRRSRRRGFIRVRINLAANTGRDRYGIKKERALTSPFLYHEA